MITTVAVAGYRSLRDIVLPSARLTVITGANGSGKSNVYRALKLLGDAAYGASAASLAGEGGLPSVLWAGPETFSKGMREGTSPIQGGPRQSRVSLRLGLPPTRSRTLSTSGYLHPLQRCSPTTRK